MRTCDLRAVSSTVIIGALTALSSLASAAPQEQRWREQVAAATEVDALARLYLELMVESNPVQATQLGLHGTSDSPTRYDDSLPDLSAQSAAAYYNDLVYFRDRLAQLDTSALMRPDQIDHHVLSNQVQLDLLDLTELGSMTNPLTYAAVIGDAYSSLVLRDYAPVDQRLASFGSRCAQTHIQS